MKHAEQVIERLLFLEAVPSMEYLPLNIGQSVKAQLAEDLKLEGWCGCNVQQSRPAISRARGMMLLQICSVGY